MAPRPPLPERIRGWRRTLAPWLTTLHARLSLAVDDVTDDDDATVVVSRRLWLHFNAGTAHDAAAADAYCWHAWLEALELVGVLARVDAEACWTLPLDLCDAAEPLRRRGLSPACLCRVPPRFELRCSASYMPTKDVLALVLGTQHAVPSLPAFHATRSLLLASLRTETGPSPVPLRFRFAVPSPNLYQSARDAPDTDAVRCLRHVLVLANELQRLVATSMATTATPAHANRRFALERAFGLSFPPTSVHETTRMLLCEIACCVPIFSLTYGESCAAPRSDLRGPFLWTLLAPYSHPQLAVGVRSLTITSRAAQTDDDVVALCSANMQSQTLRALRYDDHSTTRSAVWASHLGFALFSTHATHRIDTAVTYLAALYDDSSGRDRDVAVSPEYAPLTIAHVQRGQAARYGTLHVAALLSAPIFGEDILLGTDGEPLRSSDFAGLLRPRHRLCDVVEIEWLPDGRLAFESKTHKFPLPEPQARAFRRLCDILIFNYPAFLRHPGEMRDLQSASPTLDVWQLERTARGHELWWSPVEGVQVSAGLVASANEATKAARHLSGCATLRFWPHVWLDEVRSLWRPRPRPTAAAPAPATPLTPTEERGRADVEARVQRWRDNHPAIADALETLDWSDLLTIPGAPTTQCLLLHRMKGARLTGWARPQDAIGCPHCPSAGPGGGRLDHIMWTCPMAQRLWTALRARWTHLYSAKMRWTERALLDNVFELHLKYMPDLLWEHRELVRLPRPNTADLSATQQAVQAIWRLQVLATLHVIWKWRNDADTMEMLWSPAQGTAYHDGCMRATLVDPRWRRTADSAASCHTAAAVEILRLADPQRDFAPAQASPTTDQQYILFFDGGSRGNPGPGGSGAVVVRASHHATRASIVWSAATSAAQATTTNNQAEYAGVVAGLRAAHSNDWTPIEVVGDSQFILRQLREFRPPKNQALSVLYAEARRLGDILGIRRWTHHLREYNKMADAAANLAMDSKASSQVLHPTTRAAHAALQQHLASDFAHWQATFFSRSDST